VTTTLLAVDDSKTMRRVMEITFAGEGFKTVVAADAADALAKAETERPQVALIDAALEGTSGYDLCRQIKGASPSTVVLLLSNKGQPYDKARGTASGADDFMDKPFDTQQMIDKVLTLAKRVAQAPAQVATAPLPPTAPVASTPHAVKPAEPLRPRVQTLAYGSTPAPPPLAPAPAGAPARPAVGPAVASRASTAPGFPPSAPPPAALSSGAAAELAGKLGAIGLTAAQVDGVLALSREVVEKVVWEVVPTLAEALIKEELARLTRE
jgi:CheY-like chemotaxis protein